MNNLLLENNDFKLIQISKNNYKIIEKDNSKVIMKIQGNMTLKELKSQFYNCHKSYIII